MGMVSVGKETGRQDSGVQSWFFHFNLTEQDRGAISIKWAGFPDGPQNSICYKWLHPFCCSSAPLKEQAKGRGKNPKFPFTEHLMHVYHSGLGGCHTKQSQYLRAYNQDMFPLDSGYRSNAGRWGSTLLTSLLWAPCCTWVLSLSPQQEEGNGKPLNASTHKRYTSLWPHSTDQGKVCELDNSEGDRPLHSPWAQKDTETGHVSITRWMPHVIVLFDPCQK